MIYLTHDFYSNFNSAVNSGDNELISDMVVNELSDIIVHKTPELIKIIKERAGVKINKKASDEKIVDIIIFSLTKNVKNFSKSLAFLISQNNDSKQTVRVIQDREGQDKKAKIQNRPPTREEVDMIESGITGLADSFQYKPQLKKEFKIRLMNAIKTKSKAVGDRTRKHTENKNGKYWFLAVVVVGAAVGGYFFIKHRKKIAAEGLETLGGVKTPSTPTLPVEPIITPQPIVQVQSPVSQTIPPTAPAVQIITPPPVVGQV